MNTSNIPITLAVVGMFAVMALGALLLRQYLVARGRRGFECTLERHGWRSTSWQHGLMRFSTHGLSWFHGFSLRLSPSVQIPRRAIVDVERERIAEDDPDGDPLCLVTLRLRDGGTTRLVMDTTSGAALNSWLEAAPTGSVIGDAD